MASQGRARGPGGRGAHLAESTESFARNPVGVPFDPDAFVERLRAGETAADLVTPTW